MASSGGRLGDDSSSWERGKGKGKGTGRRSGVRNDYCHGRRLLLGREKLLVVSDWSYFPFDGGVRSSPDLLTSAFISTGPSYEVYCHFEEIQNIYVAKICVR